jgi:hypothetical protein
VRNPVDLLLFLLVKFLLAVTIVEEKNVVFML